MRRVLLLLACLSVAACGDPMRNLETLAEQDMGEDAPTLDAVGAPVSEAEEEGGVLASLMSGDDDETSEATDETGQDLMATEAPDQTDPGTDGSQAQEQQSNPPKRRGLFALFTAPKEDPPNEAQVAALVEPGDDPADTEEASLQQAALDPGAAAVDEPVSDAMPQPTANAGFLGLFAGRTAAVSDSAPKSEVSPGVVLPYGKVARVCGLSKREMGKEIAKFPEKRPIHHLYDSEPGNTAPHTLYLTGFDDGCARQFTASLAMFGSVAMHEQLRYGLPAEVQPYSDTDKAYETLKQKVCRVPKRKPCGGKLSAMERNTVFLSIYERFGANAHWSNLLLHDGKVLAQDHKAGG